MNLLLYHKDIFMPAEMSRPIHEGPLHYGRHALQEAMSDRYGRVPLPTTFCPQTSVLIESEYDRERKEVVKQVWRIPVNGKRDAVLVIAAGGFVKTVWINMRNDNHKTLDKSRYVKRHSKIK